MTDFIHRDNVRRFQRMLQQSADKFEHQRVLQLLEEEVVDAAMAGARIAREDILEWAEGDRLDAPAAGSALRRI